MTVLGFLGWVEGCLDPEEVLGRVRREWEGLEGVLEAGEGVEGKISIWEFWKFERILGRFLVSGGLILPNSVLI